MEKNDKKNKKNVNKKILESKKIIKEEKEKIKKEKRNIRNKKISKIKKTFFGSTYSLDNDTRHYAFSELFVVILTAFIGGAITCFAVIMIISGGRNVIKLSKDFGKLFDVYDTLTHNKYSDLDEEQLVEDAIDGMVSSVGDVYTSYTDIDGTEEFNELVTGTYEGIGCSIQLRDGKLYVVEVFEDGPSDKAGLKVDDIILEVDKIVVDEKTNVTELSNYIKKEAEQKIKMVISRESEKKTLTVKRGRVDTPVVDSKIYDKDDKKIGYLSISLFSSKSSNQFKKEIEKLEKEEIAGLVIDVRNNNGGYLTAVTDIVNQLLPKGKIVYQIEKDGKKEVTKDKTNIFRSYPIAVLTNEYSASASEILAAAVKESYGGYVVGVKTYGKGTVQQVKQLKDGSMIKYTIENWLTPKGDWINENGIEPTHKVELTDEYWNDPKTENDSQLQKALELVIE